MNVGKSPARGVFLLEIIVALPVCLLLTYLLGKLVVDALALQRQAGQHANLVAVGDNLVRALQDDLWASATAEWRAAELRLSPCTTHGAPQAVTYAFTPTRVERRTAEETRVWECWRLQFDWRFSRGAAAPVLALTLRELPPPQHGAVAPRSFTTLLLLPAGASGAGAEDAP